MFGAAVPVKFGIFLPKYMEIELWSSQYIFYYYDYMWGL